MHGINWTFMQAKMYQQASWWNGAQMCYQVALKILDKLVLKKMTINLIRQ